jgi:O-antigen/teichoic acid export membrane protein
MTHKYFELIFNKPNGFNFKNNKILNDVFYSFIFKGGSLIVSLFIIKMSLNIVGSLQFGIWITLSTVIQWMGILDIGIGNGLRNKFAEAKIIGDNLLAQKYVSTSYFLIFIISFIILVLFFFLNGFLNWSSLLNSPSSLKIELSNTALILFSSFCFQLVLQLISIIITADLKPKIASALNFCISIVTICSIYFSAVFFKGSILLLAICVGGAPILVYLVTSIYMFLTSFKMYRPKIEFVDFKLTRTLLTLGSKFFIVQLAMIFLLQSNNIIVSHILGPQAVTPLSIGERYFGIILILSNILMFPFWSLFTTYYYSNEFVKIKKIIKNLEYFFLGCVLFGLVMLIISNSIYKIWVGDKVVIAFSINFLLLLKNLIFTYNNIYNYFINGTGKILVQLLTYILLGIINIPLSIFLTNSFGVEGIIISNVLLILVLTIIHKVQYNKLIMKTASGIWNR